MGDCHSYSNGLNFARVAVRLGGVSVTTTRSCQPSFGPNQRSVGLPHVRWRNSRAKKNGTAHRQTPAAGVPTGGSTKTNRLAGDAQTDERRSRDSDDGNFGFAFCSSIWRITRAAPNDGRIDLHRAARVVISEGVFRARPTRVGRDAGGGERRGSARRRAMSPSVHVGTRAKQCVKAA